MAQSKVSALEGNELADDYVRTQVPQKSRWADTWEIFKNNFHKLVIINVITLLFFAPGIAIVIYRLNYIAQLGILYPFSSNALFTYPLTPSTQGVAESITLSADLLFYSLLVVASLVASVGLAGASYSIKKIINTHGQFTLKGYFHGVKVCYFNVVFPVVVFMFFVFSSFVVWDWSAREMAYGSPAGGLITARVFIIMATVIVGVTASWVLAVGVSYKVKFKYLIKNSFVLMLGSIIQTLFMLGFALIPVWFMIIGTAVQAFLIIGCILFIFLGFSFILLCWLAYTQWVFDMYVTPAVKTEKEAKRAKMTPKQLEAEKEEEEKALARELLAAGRSELIGRPLRPISDEDEVGEIGVAFGRSDISRAARERQSITASVDEYYERHKSDTRYVEYEKMFAEREKALQTPKGKKGKGKGVSSDNLLRK